MKKAFLITALMVLFLLVLPAQETSSPPPWLRPNVLEAENLIFTEDTTRLRVVSASRSNKFIDDLPVTIHVITRDEILRNHYHTLSDVLKTLPGIRVSSPGSGELGDTYQVRGLIGNFYTLVLINGLPVKPSVVTGMPLGAQLPIRQAERIEVIYGPGAAIYGADAASGVINIITRQAEEGTFVSGDISLGQKDFNYINFMIGGKAGKNRNILKYSFYGSKTEISDLNLSEGFEEAYNPLNFYQNRGRSITIGANTYRPLDITPALLNSISVTDSDFITDYYPVNYEGNLLLPEIENLPAANHMIGVQLDFRGLKITYDNMYRRVHSSIGRSSFFFKYNNPQNFWGENIQRATIGYDKAISPVFRTTTNISNLWYYMDNNSSLGVTFIRATDRVYLYSSSHDFLVEQVFTITPSRRFELVTGATYQRSTNLPITNYLKSPWDFRKYGQFDDFTKPNDELLGNFGFNPFSFNNFAAFAQTYWLLRKFTVMGGLRYDKNSVYGSSLNPRLALMYKATPITSYRLSLGYAFKAPPASLEYQSVAYPASEEPGSIRYLVVPVSFVEPNRRLEPENYKSIELGVKTKLRKKIDLNLSFYINEIGNLILDEYVLAASLNLPRAYIDNPAVDTVLYRRNVTDSWSRLYGIQGTARWNNLIPSIKFNLEGSLSFASRSESIPGLREITGLLGGFKLMPSHFGQLKASFSPAPNLYIHIETSWMSKWLRIIDPFEKIFTNLFEDVDGYYVMDVRLNYRFSENLRTFIRVDNLFDEKYGGLGVSGLATDLPYNPQMRRHIKIGLTYDLN
jgi:outer membrane receptor for ferrienterochelin and colicin